jgi:hypothetical protein
MATKMTGSRWAPKLAAGSLALALALGPAGCKHEPERRLVYERDILFAPQPPPFIAGPMATAFTNRPGFSARVVASGVFADRSGQLSGQLLGRGPWLRLALDPRSTGREKDRLEDPGFSFLWDVRLNQGYLLCEALQGYAPVSAPTRYSELRENPEAGTPRTVGSWLASPVTVTATMAEGAKARYEVWRVRELDGFPVRLNALEGLGGVDVNLSKIRIQPPPADVFVVPEGFTQYKSAEALVDEIAIRRRALKQSELLPGVVLEPYETPR